MKQRKVTRDKPSNFKDLHLKKVAYQTIVITGATSGIGLVTARMAAEKGAKVVLVSRNGKALKNLADELQEQGARAAIVEADVSREKDVERILETAIQNFGGFDTWVNNASVSIYGHTVDIPIEDMRRLFEVNYWGTVYGSLAAVRHFKEKGTPGALINLGSMAGNTATPLLTVYSASKFALHAFTDGLRMELEKEKAPVSVTQIHPAKVDTPFTDHAESYIDRQPSHRGMIYPPESVAEAILLAAEKPTRDVFVGSQAKFMALLGRIAPRFSDRYTEMFFYGQLYDPERPASPPSEGILYHPGVDLQERGSNIGWKRPKSLTVKMKKYPNLTKAVLVGGSLALLLLCTGREED